MSRRRRIKAPRVRPALLAGSVLFALAAAAVMWMALRPAYQSWRFDAVMASGAVAGAVVAAVVAALRHRGEMVVVLCGAAYVALGLAVAISGATASLGAAGDAALDLLTAPVVGWRGIVTLPLPLGEYEATLVPPFALVIAGTAAMVWLGVRSQERWGLAAAVGAAMVTIGIAVGPAARGVDAGTGWLPISREFLVGLLTLAITVGWFGWRAADARRVALREAFGRAHVQATVRAPGKVAVAAASAVLMVAGATAAGVVIAAPVVASQPRVVARSAVEPRLAVDAQVSPLAGYRAYFADDAYDAPLFTVVSSQMPDRVRIVTLPFFDGNEFSATAFGDAATLRFVRMPSPLPVQGVRVETTITIAGLSGLWVPLAGELGGVTPGGPRAADVMDGFYYVDQTRSAVMVAGGGLAPHDVLTIEASAERTRALADAGDSPETPTIATELVPESLKDWVESQDVTRDAQGLATLVSRLRARGYLSHASRVGGEASPAWVADLGAYALAEAMPGHSYDRIDRLFAALNQREAETASTDDADLVAAVGDDEQFAAAVALIAAELGFPSRVVVGAHLLDTDPEGWTEPACEAGTCAGKNMAVWAEVGTTDGAWIAVDVTPQHTDTVAPAVTDQRDPEFPSATDPERAEPIVATAALKGRSDGDEGAEDVVEEQTNWVGAALRIGGVAAGALVVLVGPLATIMAAKVVRRSRRRRGDASHVATGGWDEWWDFAVDAGIEPLPHATRTEMAAASGSVDASELAALADRATFSWGALADDAGHRAWDLVGRSRREILASRSPWRRLRIRLSTRSLRRRPQPRDQARPRVAGTSDRWHATTRSVSTRHGSVATKSGR